MCIRDRTYTIHVMVAEPTPRDITVQSSNQTYIVDAFYKGLNSTFSFGGNDLLDKTVTIKAELYGAEDQLLATSVYKDVNSLLNSWKNQQPTGKFLAAAFVVSGDVEEKWETTWTDGNPSKDNVPAKVVMTVIDDIGQTHTAEEDNIQPSMTVSYTHLILEGHIISIYIFIVYRWIYYYSYLPVSYIPYIVHCKFGIDDYYFSRSIPAKPNRILCY